MNGSDCESIFAALSNYLDGELPEADCNQLERHIQDCAPCVEFVNSLRKSVRLGKQYRPHEPAPALSPCVKRSLEAAYKAMLARQQEPPPEKP